MKRTFLLCLFSIGAAFGQCFDDDLRGSYGFMASTGATTATTSTAGSFSNTPIGLLVGSMNGINGGDAAGAFYFDGVGRIYGNYLPTMPQGVTRDAVGSYAVSSDCTVRVTIFDAYNDTVTPTSPNNPVLTGLVLRGGDEMLLTRPASIRTAIRFVRFSDRYTAGCVVSMLRGPYGLVVDGANKETFAALIARAVFDGDGKIVASGVTGAYIVKNDCTGSMLLSPDGATTVNVKFLITPESGYVDAAGRLSTQPAQDLKPGLLLSIFDTDRALTGTGTAQ